MLKWFSRINLFIFERKPRHRVSGVRCQESPDLTPETKKSWKAINKLVMHPIHSYEFYKLGNLLTPAAGQYGKIRECDFNRLCAPGFGRLKPGIKNIKEIIT